MQQIVLIGAGGHCRSCIDVIEKENKYVIHGVLDRAESGGESILNYPVIGTDDQIPELAKNYSFFISVGQIQNSAIRPKLYSLIKACGGTVISVVSPSAVISSHSTIGNGTIVMHNAVVNALAKIGENCIINTLSNIEHDAEIGDHCHISTGALINGGVTIGSNCFIGSGAIIFQNVSIPPNTIIGAGTVVKKSIHQSGIYAGNPAKLFKSI